MGSYNRDDRSAGGYRGGFSRGGSRGGFSRGGGSSFGGGRGGDRGDRPMFEAICSNCGKTCQVPFRPTNGKPVYCSDCFEKMGNRSDSRGPSNDRPRFEERRPSFDPNKAQLDSMNMKLDKILTLLNPPKVEKAVKEVKIEVSEPKTVKVAEVVDLPKIKKTVKKATKKVKSTEEK